MLANDLEMDRERSHARTLFGLLDIFHNGGSMADMAPHLFDAGEARRAREEREQAERERKGQIQQLMLLKRLSENG